MISVIASGLLQFFYQISQKRMYNRQLLSSSNKLQSDAALGV